MVTYVNDLRLSELATGEGSGTWGTTTNTNLELIGEALGYGTEQSFSSDADATTTIGDGVSDPARAMYFKVTSAGSLTATRTLTIAPNTVSRVMFIENATTGSQSIAISQGSGANVTIAAGKTAVVYLDGAGSGAAVVDAMAGVDPGVTDTLAEVLAAGNTTGGTDIVMSAGDNITNASGDLTLDIAGDIILDAGGSEIRLSKAGTEFGKFATDIGTPSQFAISSSVLDGDIKLQGNDGGSTITALTLDMSEAGAATFNAGATFASDIDVTGSVTADGLTVNGTGSIVALSDNAVFNVNVSGGTSKTSTINQRAKSSNGSNADASIVVTGSSGEAVSSWDFKLDTANGALTKAMSIDGSGNLSLYEDTGTTPKFFWNSSAESLTLNGSGAGSLTLDRGASGNQIKFANAGATLGYIGYAATIGFAISGADGGADVTVDTSGNVNIYGTDNRPLAITSFATASAGAGWDLDATSTNGVVTVSTGGTERLRIDSLGGITGTSQAGGHVVFNEGGVDSDFRVESDTNANMLFVDGGNDHVNIGTATDLQGVLNVDGNVSLSGAGTGNRSIALLNESNLYEGSLIIQAGGVSAAYGGAIRLYGHSHASKPGDVVAGISSGSGGSFRVNTSGVDVGTDRLEVTEAGSFTVTPGAGNHAVFNEGGIDADFRVEGDNYTHALFVDASVDRVGIGRSAPDSTLDVISLGTNAGYGTVRSKSENSVDKFYEGFQAVPSDSGGDAQGGIHIGSNTTADGLIAVGGYYANAGTLTPRATSGTSIQFSSDIIRFRSNTGLTVGTDYTPSNRFEINSAETVVNQISADHDFRVESDANSHMLFVDGGNDKVIIGSGTISAPSSYHLLSYGAGASARSAFVHGSGDGGVVISGSAAGSSASVILGNNWGTNGATFSEEWRLNMDGADDSLKFKYNANASTALTLYTAGGITTTPAAGGHAIFNESGVDADFRVESDGNANALFVDASAGTVAINTATLTHAGNTAGSLIVNGGSTGSTSPIMMVIDGDGSVEGDSVLLECSFVNDDGFSSARYVQFRDSGGTQGSISGTGAGTVAYNTSSDERLKQNIQDTDSKWDLVKSLQVRDYEWKKSGKQDTGFIAQELHDKWAQPVKVGGEDVTNDPWSVDYGKLTPILTKALQEAMEKIESLEARIAALES